MLIIISSFINSLYITYNVCMYNTVQTYALYYMSIYLLFYNSETYSSEENQRFTFCNWGGGGEIKLSRRKLLSLHKEPLVTLSSNWSSDEELYVKGKLEQGGHMNVQIDQCVMSRHWTLCLNSVFG